MPDTKILYILPQPFLLSRGSSFRALATVNALAELGYQVDLLCYPLGIDPKKRQYAIHRSRRPPLLTSVKIGPSPQKIIFDIPLACMAHRMVRRNGYAVIHGVEEAGFIASWLGRKFNVPYIFDMHSWMSQQIEDGNYLKSRLLLNLFKKFESQAMNRARAIITVGPEMTEILRTRLAPGVYAATLPDCPLVFDDDLAMPDSERISAGSFSTDRARRSSIPAISIPIRGSICCWKASGSSRPSWLDVFISPCSWSAAGQVRPSRLPPIRRRLRIWVLRRRLFFAVNIRPRRCRSSWTGPTSWCRAGAPATTSPSRSIRILLPAGCWWQPISPPIPRS